MKDVAREEKEIESDLRELADSGRIDAGCRPISVPGVQAVPRLGLWLGLAADDFRLSGEGEREDRGYFLIPASAGARLHYGSAQPPPGSRLLTENPSWRLYSRC